MNCDTVGEIESREDVVRVFAEVPPANWRMKALNHRNLKQSGRRFVLLSASRSRGEPLLIALSLIQMGV